MDSQRVSTDNEAEVREEAAYQARLRPYDRDQKVQLTPLGVTPAPPIIAVMCGFGVGTQPHWLRVAT